MIYGIIKTETYRLINGRWTKQDEWTEARSIIDRKHWESWQQYDTNGSPKPATLKTQCGYMVNYCAYGPAGDQKVKVRLLCALSGDSYHNVFRKLDTISVAEFKKLRKKAQKCAARKGLDINESCFISSSDLHGFYFPNSNKYRGVFFCNGEAVLLTNEQAEL